MHAILTDAKGRNLETKKTTACKTDELTHVYTLHLMPNNTYRILIDNAEAAKGALHEDWDFEAPKQIMARARAQKTKREECDVGHVLHMVWEQVASLCLCALKQIMARARAQKTKREECDVGHVLHMVREQVASLCLCALTTVSSERWHG